VDERLVRTVLKENYSMRYKKIQRSNLLGNLDRSLVLRQHYAKLMIPLLADGRRVICIDETFLPTLDYRKSKWCKKGQKNTLASKDLSARVNMICGLDTDGNIYPALTMVNTDSSVLVSYLCRLSTVLTAEDPNWRAGTIFIMDGAKYHRSPDTRLALKRLGITYVITGPYGYDAQPIEYLFSYFKQAQINPEY
jgi:hypothetical protein